MVVAAHRLESAAFLYIGDTSQSDGWGIKVVGRAPLRWPDRVVGASHRGPLVDQQLRRR